MAELIVYSGQDTFTLPRSSDTRYLYRIGSGEIQCGEVIDLNNVEELNELAEEIRDEYSEWVYSLNKIFLLSDLTTKDLSLFFFTDLSCKRSEFFDTYDTVCNLLLIQKKLSGVELSSARLIGVNSEFINAFRSIFPDTEIITNNQGSGKYTWARRLGADLLYLGRLFGLAVINRFRASQGSKKDEKCRIYFFSIFPQMFSENSRDSKYGNLVTESDRYLVSILTDGMHQVISLSQYLRFRREAIDKGYIVADDYVQIKDVVIGLMWLIKCQKFFFRERKRNINFKGMEIWGLMRPELRYSLSRIIRLGALCGAFGRVFQVINIQEFVYYPHEYPFGRMISYLLKAVRPNVLRTGFQMSPVSWRRMEQFLAEGEASQSLPFLHHVPIPDRVLAEDVEAAGIYRHSGYKNVEVMEEIYRYAHLESVVPERRERWLLIVPGLHDGELMLESLKADILENPKNTYLLKPHPRANNAYLKSYENLPNIKISNRPLTELFGIVTDVFVTYSSAGIEAKKIGLRVIVISVPGKINTSPLLDRKTKSDLSRESHQV